MRKRITTRKFREQYKPGAQLPKDLVVCRAEPFSIHKDADSTEGDLTKTFTISTPTVDREGDRLLLNWELESFRKGGSVLWGHDSRTSPSHVIAAPVKTWQDSDSLKSTARFTPHEINPVGFMVHQLIDFGALRSSSVGFIPKEWKIIEDEGRAGYDFEKLELLEWSVVPVPANPEALVDAKDYGIDVAPFVELAEEILDKDLDLVVVERDLVEASWKAVKPASAQVPIDKAAIPFKKHPLAAKDESWSGPKEVAAAAVEDLKIMCTWYDKENADVKNSYKLPHHKAESKNTVWKGVAAAMGALLGARGGVDIPDADRRKVYDHLAKHYKEFDEEPPEFKAYSQRELEEMFGAMPSMSLTIDATQATEVIDKLAELVLQLDKRVEGLAEKLEAATKKVGKPPQRAVMPDGGLFDLSGPALAKIVKDEIGQQVDATIRKLTGQLPD